MTGRKAAAGRRAAALLALGVGLALALHPWPSGAASSRPATGPAAAAPPAAAPPAATPPAAATPARHVVTRPERAVLLVTLTFLVGVGILGAPGGPEPGPEQPTRPRLSLNDDPARALRPDERPARPAGAPPPLR